jgi:hypothetical protein
MVIARRVGAMDGTKMQAILNGEQSAVVDNLGEEGTEASVPQAS